MKKDIKKLYCCEGSSTWFVPVFDGNKLVSVCEWGTTRTYSPERGARCLRFECDAYSARIAYEAWLRHAEEAYSFFA